MSAALRNASLKIERETTMKTTKNNTGIKVTAGVKAGGFTAGMNHSRSGLKVRSAIKGGGFTAGMNHNGPALKVRSGVKGGELIRASNHNVRMIAVA